MDGGILVSPSRAAYLWLNGASGPIEKPLNNARLMRAIAYPRRDWWEAIVKKNTKLFALLPSPTERPYRASPGTHRHAAGERYSSLPG